MLQAIVVTKRATRHCFSQHENCCGAMKTHKAIALPNLILSESPCYTPSSSRNPQPGTPLLNPKIAAVQCNT
jgi:hypothetical protein